jgi:hypothetical protein
VAWAGARPIGSLVAKSGAPTGGDGAIDDDGVLRRVVAGHPNDDPLGVAERAEDLVRDSPVVGGLLGVFTC